MTQEGLLTVEWAREILNAVDRLAAGAGALAHSGQEELAIGTSMTIAEHLLPAWIGTFRSRHPQVATKLRVMNSAHVIEAVSTGAVDLGFVETPDIPPSLTSTLVWTDQLVAVTGTEHPWTHREDPLDTAELAVTPLVEREQGSGTRAFLDRLVGDHRPAPLLELNSNSAICQAVIEDIGPAVLSRLAVESFRLTGQLVEVPTSGQKLNRTLKALWKDPSALTGATGEFLEVARAGFRPTHQRD